MWETVNDRAQTHVQNCVETLLTPHWPIVFFYPRKAVRILSWLLTTLPPPLSGFAPGRSALFGPNVRVFYSKNPALKPKMTQFVRVIDLPSPTFRGPPIPYKNDPVFRCSNVGSLKISDLKNDVVVD